MVASVVAMDEADARRLEDNNAAQLIGALPFLAGCAHPERTALSHLTTLIAASRNPHVFGQKPSESIRDRLRPIETFENGDRDIIERVFLSLGGDTIPYSTISIRGTVDYCGAEEREVLHRVGQVVTPSRGRSVHRRR